jgi:hypothetical protein
VGGGWVVGLAVLLLAVAAYWRGHDMVSGHGDRAVGDGTDPATYGFDLDASLVPRTGIAASGLPRDGLPVLDYPRLLAPAQADSLHREAHYKYLVPGDRVIGVALGGQARAYPISVMNWHEVVNDTLGGQPIAVTYSPLGDASVVFDRRLPPPIAADGAFTTGDGPDRAPNARTEPDTTVLFSLSGLLYNSNLLMYDRRDGHRGESLFNQLQARAVAGPAAVEGRRLQVIPCVVARWGDWRARHPATTVLYPEPSRRERYQRNPYAHDYGSDQLRYAVDPLPPRDTPGRKTPCVIVGVDHRYVVYPLPLIARHAGLGGTWQTTQGAQSLRFGCSEDASTAWVEAPGRTDIEVFYSFWYAWYSCRPGESSLAE